MKKNPTFGRANPERVFRLPLGAAAGKPSHSGEAAANPGQTKYSCDTFGMKARSWDWPSPRKRSAHVLGIHGDHALRHWFNANALQEFRSANATRFNTCSHAVRMPMRRRQFPIDPTKPSPFRQVIPSPNQKAVNCRGGRWCWVQYPQSNCFQLEFLRRIVLQMFRSATSDQKQREKSRVPLQGFQSTPNRIGQQFYDFTQQNEGRS